jgi:S-adenosylmethionine:tRNA ribosyltransferase-isomerase
MIPADLPVQRPVDAKLLVVNAQHQLRDVARPAFVDLLRPGDLVVANDAATLPASLHGHHLATGSLIEVRLAGRRTLDAEDVSDFVAVVFGAGDFHTRTENRPTPPRLIPGDRLALGPLMATVTSILDHPRLVSLHFDGTADTIWAGIARHGRPIQYAHMLTSLALWDVWTPIAGRLAAFEPPSAGFVLNWRTVAALHEHRIGFTTITHAAGISSTGDDELDNRLPLDEPYEISEAAAAAVATTRQAGGRIVAIGTTVVRALEHAAAEDGVVRAGGGLANQRIGPATRLKVVDALLTGVHERGTSHYELLRAFADNATLQHADEWLEQHRYRTHEFGDSMFIERPRQTCAMSLTSLLLLQTNDDSQGK